jgi:hypothetical protein
MKVTVYIYAPGRDVYACAWRSAYHVTAYVPEGGGGQGRLGSIGAAECVARALHVRGDPIQQLCSTRPQPIQNPPMHESKNNNRASMAVSAWKEGVCECPCKVATGAQSINQQGTSKACPSTHRRRHTAAHASMCVCLSLSLSLYREHAILRVGRRGQITVNRMNR